MQRMENVETKHKKRCKYSKLQLSGLIGTEGHPDKHKIRIIGFFFENRQHWQFEVRLLLITVWTFVQTFLPRLI